MILYACQWQAYLQEEEHYETWNEIEDARKKGERWKTGNILDEDFGDDKRKYYYFANS